MAFGPVGRITAVVLPVLLLGGAPASRAEIVALQPRATALVDFHALDAPPFATNAAVQSARGDIAVLIDEASIAPGREQGMRDAVTHFLSRTSPADRVRLISLRPVGPALPFEEGLRDLPAALARFTGHSTASETANDLVCRSQTALDMLRSLVGNYSGGPMPTFVIVSGGFGSPPSGGVTSFGNYGKCPPLRGLDFEELGGAARAINAAIYVVHPTDATGSRLPRTDLERGVETLAGALGADVIRAVAPSPASMAKIATQTSSYYLAGFDLDSSDRADAPLRIELRSRRPDVTIRARQELPGRRAATTIAVPLPDAMIRVPTTYRDLALRAAAFPSRADSDGKVRLVVLFEPEDPALKVTAASIGLYDAKGRLSRWTAEPADLVARPATAGIIVPAGDYRMRVAASTGAAAGSVDTEVSAALPDAASMTMSALLLGVSGPDGLLPRLQFSAADNGAFGYLEIYKVPRGAAPNVRFELAATADGASVASEEVALTPGPKDDVRIAFSGFAIDGMPPGELVMRAIVSLDGKVVGRVHRTLRKVK